MGSPSRNVQYHPPRLSEDRLNLPQPHSPSLPYTLLREIGNAPQSKGGLERPDILPFLGSFYPLRATLARNGHFECRCTAGMAQKTPSEGRRAP